MATGSKDAAKIASTVTSDAVKIVGAKAVYKSLSGKYLKLNKFEKILKYLTAPPYYGKYGDEKNHLPEVFKYGLKEFRIDVGNSIWDTMFPQD